MKPFQFKMPRGTCVRPVFLVKPPQYATKRANQAHYKMVDTTKTTIVTEDDWYFRYADIILKYKVELRSGKDWRKLEQNRYGYAVVLLRNSVGRVSVVQMDERDINAFIVARKSLVRV